ncbi:MAG: ATP synthase F1 subunit gamma [Acidobacteriota bacterium]|nr:ATP synthase F1 subunit gamma [Acidobacteriota bacterium]
MAKTQDLKRRIRSIKNTQQLTRAMKMVSAAKLRRAQERVLAARPYAQRTLSVLQSLARRANPELNPLLRANEGDRVDAVIMSSDRGLCGAFNASVFRLAEAHLSEHEAGAELTIATVGKKSREYYRRRDYNIVRDWADIFRQVEFSTAREIADLAMERYIGGDASRVYLIHNSFKSAIAADPVAMQLLPILPASFDDADSTEDYLYEPSAQVLFDALLPHYVQQAVYQAMLESVAAEHAARMTAMDSATSNAGELIEALTLTMNRARQASITTEIIEVVSGAAALG